MIHFSLLLKWFLSKRPRIVGTRIVDSKRAWKNGAGHVRLPRLSLRSPGIKRHVPAGLRFHPLGTIVDRGSLHQKENCPSSRSPDFARRNPASAVKSQHGP
jgi:hypothetical protein